MATSPTHTHWHLPDPSQLVVRRYSTEGEYLVFNAASGDVHLLNTAAIGILDRLSRSSASLIDLCNTSVDSEDSGAVEKAIRQLDQLGLIHPELTLK